MTYFKSLTLANLSAALYSVRRQDLSRVARLILVDNDTSEDVDQIHHVVGAYDFPVPVDILSFKHGQADRTHSWSTNVAVRAADTPWIFFTRADYILDFDLLLRLLSLSGGSSGFFTSDFRHLHVPIEQCEQAPWRISGPAVFSYLPGVDESYSLIDSGVWLLSRNAFDVVGGMDEDLNAWGHAQTHFQYRLFSAGMRMEKIAKVLFYHPFHSAPRDIDLAHQQLGAKGLDIRDLWARYSGASPY